jgi:hypothetical protein
VCEHQFVDRDGQRQTLMIPASWSSGLTRVLPGQIANVVDAVRHPRRRRLLSLARTPEALAQQELDRGHPASHVGTGASIRERSPHALRSTVNQTGFTAEPAASSSEVFSCPRFSAAAAAERGRTVAGYAGDVAREVRLRPVRVSETRSRTGPPICSGRRRHW